MFKAIESISELNKKLKKRKNPIKKSSKLPEFIDSHDYIDFILNYDGVEITPDINIMNYESSLNENKYISNDYPFFNEKYWLFASSGQGDSWVIEISTGSVLFYDHNQGDINANSQFINLQIDFCKFIKMAFLFKDLESHLDFGELTHSQKLQFKNEINKLGRDLFELYPYKYF